MNACTIIAKNYVAQARVLARSFADHHPDGRFWVLVIDDYEGYLDPATEPFELVGPEDIGCDDFDDMATRYSVLELSTAVKPWLLRHLLDTTGEPVTYLDPDIQIFSALEELDQAGHAHGVVVTPHNLVPLPDDGKRPSQLDIMIAGVYNLGYITVAPRPDVRRLLNWWADRLLYDCRVDVPRGLFVDQRWFDLAPGLLDDLRIWREPQYNVAYWNLPHRGLEIDDDGYRVLDRPLAFFHFSGFDPDQSAELSQHQDRIRLAEHPALNQICQAYAEAALEAGYRTTRRWPYSFGELPGGIRYDAVLREMYRIALDRGELWESPLTESGAAALIEWLGAQQPGAPPGVNRLLAHLYGTRSWLRARFPDVAGADRGRLLEWARSEGAGDVPALAALPDIDVRQAAPRAADAPQPAAAPPAARPAAEMWGVNVVGYFRSELGVGEAARQVVGALDTQGVSVLPIHGQTIPLSRQGHYFLHLGPADAQYPVNLICMNADALPEFAHQAGDGFFRDRYSVGLWFWEVNRFREEWRPSFDLIDEVWVPSAHVAAAVSRLATIPVRVMRMPVVVAPVISKQRSALGLPGDFLFLFSFDYRSIFERKNPLAVVDAFTRAFAPGDGASLVIKCINDEADPANHSRLLSAAARRPDVQVMDRYVSAEDKDALTAACDCYVSLHRSEGFGYTMAEAMYLGKPTIATAYSGNLEFMTAENSLLVDYKLVEVGRSHDPYPADAQWAEPDVVQAAEHMRWVFENRAAAAMLGARAAETIWTQLSPTATGAAMNRRLEEIRANREYWRRPEAGRELAVDPQLSGRIAKGPWNLQPNADAAKRLWRRGILRVMKPYIAYQQALNAEFARSMASLDAAEARLEALTTRLGSSLLAALRRGEALQRLAPITDQLDGRLASLEFGAYAAPYMEGEPFSTFDEEGAGRVFGYRNLEDRVAADAYRAFEDVFRGAEPFIRDRQRRYLPIIGAREPVFDLGCGRGELLDLLRDAGIRYVGVDSDPGMVARCRAKGHAEVELGDGLERLDAAADGSIGVIFAAQVIEHLPEAALRRLVALAQDKLATGGELILETVNPHAPAALKTFWVDLTHEQPVFPEVALELCREAGFSTAYVFYPNGVGDVDVDRTTQGEYAVVALKETPR